MRLSASVFVVWAALACVASVGFATEAVVAPAKSRTWVAGPKAGTPPGCQVCVDSAKQSVAVSFDRAQGNVPRSVGITFMDANGKRTPMELKAMDPEPAAGPRQPVRYSGALNPAAQSFVGFELKIPFSSKTPTVVRSEDLKPTE